MIPYASRTGTLKNLAALRAADWRLLVSRAGSWRSEGFRYCLDCGTWSDFQAGLEAGLGGPLPFEEVGAEPFGRLLDKMGAGADFTVLPDIVAGGLASLDLSLRWMDRTLGATPRALIAVQDGMEHADLAPFVGPNVGIFLGGSTEWKLERMADWGRFCAAAGVHYHVARVNTAKRMAMAIAAGADSIDGSSATRYAKTLPLLDNARRQPDMFSPRA